MRGIYIRFQVVGFGPDPQNDLFVRGFRLWLFTIFISKTDLVGRIGRMRDLLAAGTADIEARRRAMDGQ